jgi:hypothetical protein
MTSVMSSRSGRTIDHASVSAAMLRRLYQQYDDSETGWGMAAGWCAERSKVGLGLYVDICQQVL